MRKNLIVILTAILLFCGLTEKAVAQFGGEGAFGSIVNYLKRVATNVIPSVNNTYDLGSSSKAWKEIFATTATYNDVDIADNTPYLEHRDTDDNTAYMWHLD